MIKPGIKYQFGNKLREIRERKGLTMKEVAAGSQVSESLISQIERNKVSPSLDTLLAITDVLETDMEYIFRDYRKDKKVRIIKKSERKMIKIPGVVYQQLSLLAEPADRHSMEGFLLEIAAGAEKGNQEYGHTGKEFGFILRGRGELFYGTGSYSLEEGDSVSFAANIPHVLKNTGNRTLKAVWIIIPMAEVI